jgi:homocysteine S-methyltransferase
MKMNSNSFVIIDGALGTLLEEEYNIKLTAMNWSSSCLETHPEALSEIHFNYFSKGSDICLTASYQCSPFQYEKNCDKMLQLSVSLCKEAREKFWKENKDPKRTKPLVAASVGPYGSCLGAGGEYNGKYIDEENLTENQIENFFQFRIENLEKESPDLYAFETFPSLKEIKIVLKVVEKYYPKIKAWISFTCKDEKHTSYGENFEDCVKYVSKFPQIIAVGVNCTDPNYCLNLMKIGKENTSLDLICYPNSGEIFVPENNTWKGENHLTDDFYSDLISLGVKYLGGCCRTNYKTIELLSNLRNKK